MISKNKLKKKTKYFTISLRVFFIYIYIENIFLYDDLNYCQF